MYELVLKVSTSLFYLLTPEFSWSLCSRTRITLRRSPVLELRALLHYYHRPIFQRQYAPNLLVQSYLRRACRLKDRDQPCTVGISPRGHGREQYAGRNFYRITRQDMNQGSLGLPPLHLDMSHLFYLINDSRSWRGPRWTRHDIKHHHYLHLTLQASY